MTRKTFCTSAATAAAAVALGANVSASGLPTIRVGYLASESCAQLFYAQANGFCKRAGIELELIPFSFGSLLAAAVATGAVDIGYGTVMTLATSHARDVPFEMIAPGNAFLVGLPTTGMLMSSLPAVRTGRDLNGKTIGSPGLQTLGEYGVRRWVDATGGDSNTLHFVEVPFAGMVDALAAQRIDAAYVPDPFLELAKRKCYPVAVELDSIARHFIISGWFSMKGWIAANPSLVTRFADVIRDATDWASAHPAACNDILVRYMKVERSAIDGSPRIYFARNLTTQLIQPGIDLAAMYGKFPPFPASDLVYDPRLA